MRKLFSSRTKMKRLGEHGELTVHSLSEQMYLFVPKGGTDRVVISAHGGRTQTTQPFTVPSDSVLRFYSEDTNSVLDPGLDNFYTFEVMPREIIAESEPCYDYELSKYQGRHGNRSETYASIADTITRESKAKHSFLTAAAKTTNAQVKSASLKEASKRKLAAVLTIRNRFNRPDVNLSLAIEQVKNVAPEILIFDCLFCRYMKGGGAEGLQTFMR